MEIEDETNSFTTVTKEDVYFDKLINEMHWEEELEISKTQMKTILQAKEKNEVMKIIKENRKIIPDIVELLKNVEGRCADVGRRKTVKRLREKLQK